MRSGGDYVPEKKAIPVEIGLINSGSLKGKLWVSAGKSLTDTLNGTQPFLEFSPYGDERTHHVAKAHVVSLVPVEMPKVAPLYERRGVVDADDPHHILGIAPGAPWQAVREAYLRLTKACHPDKYAGVELPTEVNEYLGVRARRINAAYSVLEDSIKHSAGSASSAANYAVG